jgi:hypothetical protein
VGKPSRLGSRRLHARGGFRGLQGPTPPQKAAPATTLPATPKSAPPWCPASRESSRSPGPGSWSRSQGLCGIVLRQGGRIRLRNIRRMPAVLENFTAGILRDTVLGRKQGRRADPVPKEIKTTGLTAALMLDAAGITERSPTKVRTSSHGPRRLQRALLAVGVFWTMPPPTGHAGLTAGARGGNLHHSNRASASMCSARNSPCHFGS